jgi:CHAT domain-containing protein
VAFILIRKWLGALFIATIVLVLCSGNPAMLAGNQLSECSRLTGLLSLGETVCQGKDAAEFKPQLTTIKGDQTETLHQLGIVLRQLRYLDASGAVLKRALELDPNNETIALSLANLQQQAYRRAIYNYKSTDEPATQLAAVRDGLEHASSGLENYLSLSKDLTSESQIFAALNWLTLWSSLEPSISDSKDLQQQQASIASRLIDRLRKNLPAIDARRQPEARLSLAESLLRTANPSFTSLSRQNAEEVINVASSNSDLRLLSKAYGIKGQLIKKENPEIAIAEFGRALSAAQSIRANELAYKWQWELAKLYRQTGKPERALELYEASLKSINQIRDGILQLSVEIQYDFRDKVEPLYREYIGLLFNTPNPDIEKVVRVNDQLQIAELENYLQCSRLKVSSLLDVSATKSPDVGMYIIRLPNRYAVVIRSKNGTFSHRILDGKTIDQSLKLVKRTLQGDRFDNLAESTYKTNFGSLYQSIFAPIEDLLPQKGTLLITADSSLQSIPWAMLFDGQKYLIERYAIAYSLGSELANSNNQQKTELKVLIAGLSEETDEKNYSALPNVLKEVEAIQSEIGIKTKTLLNEKFTITRLIKESENYPIIHFATHGQVSSNPRKSFILGWNERITLSELQNVVRNRNSRLELLVLSACEAAKGDNRATLGIAGSAYQAGAQSTIATLWLVEDESQSKLMEALYTALKNDKSKAEALRDAQLSLLNSKDIFNRNPFLWGSVILLGSWE